MMRERSLSKRILDIKEEAKKYDQDNFRAVSPNGKTLGNSSPDFFKRKSQSLDNSDVSDNSDDNKDSSSLGYEKV